MATACTICTCGSFTPHAFLKQKCITVGCSHPADKHTRDPTAQPSPTSNSESVPMGNTGGIISPTSTASSHTTTATTPVSAASSPKLPPPLPTLTNSTTTSPTTAVTEVVTPPPTLQRKSSLPPPLPPSLMKQTSPSVTTTDAPVSAPVSAIVPPAVAARPIMPPRPSLKGELITTTPTILATQSSAIAPSSSTLSHVRPPPPLPSASTYVSASGSFPPPLPTSTASNWVSSSGSFPPPIPPHLRTVSDSEPNSGVSVNSPSFNANNPFSPQKTPFSPTTPETSSAPSPASSTNITSPQLGSVSKPPPLPTAGSTSKLLDVATTATSTNSSTDSTDSSQQWVDPNYRPSFALRLHHKFDVVVDQSNAGIRLLKRVRAFMQRFSTLQQHYASELQKMISIERNKLIAMPKPDQMTSCYSSWLGFFENMDELSNANLNFSQELKEITVEQLERWYSIGTMMVKEQKSEQERVSNAMLKVNLSVAKERDAANQALQKLLAQRGDDTSSSGGSSSAAGASVKKGAPTFLDSIFKSANPQKSFEKSREAAIKACESYQTALTQANTSHQRYHQEELPAMLTQMQSLEEMRLHSLNSALRDFSRLQKTFTSKMSEISDVISQLSGKMDANSDIQNFVNKVIEEHGPALAPVPYTYDIPLSLSELKAMQFDEPPSSLFYSTLDGVMKHQKGMESMPGSTAHSVASASAPNARHASLEMPLIVPTLLRAISENDGQHTEGIFRISVGSEELTRIRRQLEQGDFVLKENNPHVPACLLKSWFRDLLIPVFPWSVYERCIQVGQLEPWSSTNPTQVAMVKAIMAELPPLNEKIIALLFGFLKRLSSESSYVSKTRMNLPNLSLVFSPGLVRSEKNDPMQMLQDTKYASNFVLRAIECSPSCFTPESQQCSQSILDEIFKAEPK